MLSLTTSLNSTKANQQKYVQVGNKQKVPAIWRSESSKVDYKNDNAASYIFNRYKKQFFTNDISHYKKKWSFSQTKVKVDNNPKSRFFLLGLKYTFFFCVFNFFVEFLSWTEKYFCTAKNLTKTVLTQNMSSRILYINIIFNDTKMPTGQEEFGSAVYIGSFWFEH